MNKILSFLKSPQGEKTLKCALVVLICLVSLAHSLMYAEVYGKYSEEYFHDEDHYIKMAKRILEDGEYSYWGEGSDAYVTPGFPMFLTGLFALFGTDLQGIHMVKIVQSLMMCLSTLLLFVLAYRLTKRYWASIIAAILLATHTVFHFYARRLLTETLFVFVMLLFFVAVVYAFEKEKGWLYFLTGILLCAAMLVRPLIVIVLPILLIYLAVKNRKNWKGLLLKSGALLIGFVLLGLPWWIRNMITMDQFIFLATQTNPIFEGLAPSMAELGYEDPGTMFGNIKLFFKVLFDQPLDTLYWFTFGKFKNIFLTETLSFTFNDFTDFVNHFTVMVGLCGCVKGLFDNKLRWPIVLFLIYLLSMFAFIPVARYALAYLPFFAIGAGYLLDLVFFKHRQLQ